MVLQMQISKAAKKINNLLPIQLADMQVKHLTWGQFKGEVGKQNFSAHIYWAINYQIKDPVKRTIHAQVLCQPRSWVRPQRKCEHLLNHEQGHLLIGSLCMLEFVRRVHTNKSVIQPQNYQAFVASIFNRTMREYLEMERRYDLETDHRLKPRKQEEWDGMMLKQLKYYKSIFNQRKGMFRRIKGNSKR